MSLNSLAPPPCDDAYVHLQEGPTGWGKLLRVVVTAFILSTPLTPLILQQRLGPTQSHKIITEVEGTFVFNVDHGSGKEVSCRGTKKEGRKEQ